jgi:hypothetical protein
MQKTLRSSSAEDAVECGCQQNPRTQVRVETVEAPASARVLVEAVDPIIDCAIRGRVHHSLQ